MENKGIKAITRLAFVSASLLVLKVVFTVVSSYPDYFPPNFQVDFLLGRGHYFWQGYHWAFYVHIISGPISLLLGVVLISKTFRCHWPAWHRGLGRIQVLNVLLLVVPSGLWMSWWSMGGRPAGAAFAMLAVATGFCITMGWRRAVQRQFASHNRWMGRVFVLLFSAVTLRVFGGLAFVLDIEAEWTYALSGWLSWAGPLLFYECYLIWLAAPERYGLAKG